MVTPSNIPQRTHEEEIILAKKQIVEYLGDIKKATADWKREGGRIDPVSVILTNMVFEQQNLISKLEALYYNIKFQIDSCNETIKDCVDDYVDIAETIEQERAERLRGEEL